jgi:hypothetical protein
VYITEEESFGPEDFARTDALVWLQEDVPLGDYAVPERSIHLQYPPTPVRAPPPSTPPPPCRSTLCCTLRACPTACHTARSSTDQSPVAAPSRRLQQRRSRASR